MKNFKQLLLAAACAAGLSATAFAQQAAPADHGAHHPQGAATAAATELSEGEVRKVDKSAGKITIKHGEIKNLDMPPMTMVFGVKDAAMLDKVKAGDKVRFRAASEDGKFTVSEIQAAGATVPAVTVPAAQAQPMGAAPAAAVQVAQAQPAGAASTALSEGEIRKVDKATGKITVKHGEIKNLDMPPMTMVFGVKDAAMLDKVKAGDKVRFRAASEEGKFTITEIQAAAQ